MNELIAAARDGGGVSQALFLMVCGMSFVFVVQVVFYVIIAAWPKDKKA